MPIGGAKKNPPPEPAGDDEDRPLPKGSYNLDALGEDAFGGPPPAKKAPPARFKPKDDEEMKDEAPKAPPPKPKVEEKKAPAQKAAPAKGAPAKAAAGAAGGDDDAGGGMSKEEVEAKMQEAFPPEVLELLTDDKKWAEKVEGFKGIQQSLLASQPTADIIEAVVRFTKSKMKDWKESNINLVKETLALFGAISQNCEKLGKRSVFIMMPFLSDKLGDVKQLAVVSELLLSLSEVVTPKYVALQVIKHASSAKSPNVIKESCNILVKMIEDFGGLCMPIKDMMDYGILSVNNTNP